MTSNSFQSWTPTVSGKHPDSIVSSEFTTAKKFRPSYEREEPCIEQLLANEYQRIWLTERDEWLNKLALSKDENKRRHKFKSSESTNKKAADKSTKTTRSTRTMCNSQATGLKQEKKP